MYTLSLGELFIAIHDFYGVAVVSPPPLTEGLFAPIVTLLW